jgi:BirA family biotin operon repressor/biotin-[acetyl-CoA-carboxylase] ligase
MTPSNINSRLTEPIDIRGLHDKLGDSLFSTNIVFHETLASTNALAKELALAGAPEGTIVLAEEQTAGRGRMKRQWRSPGYSNILVTVLLRPTLPKNRVFMLTMIMALATIKGVKQVCDLESMIKWPNDLYIEYKKLGGILTEFSIKKNRLEYVIIGLGLNVNWNPSKQEGLLYPTTSIQVETGLQVSRTDLLFEILKSLEHYYQEVLANRIENLYKQWNDHSLVIDKIVTVESPDESFQGKVLRIDHQGGLVIVDNQGKEQTILSGDVSIKMVSSDS